MNDKAPNTDKRELETEVNEIAYEAPEIVTFGTVSELTYGVSSANKGN